MIGGFFSKRKQENVDQPPPVKTMPQSTPSQQRGMPPPGLDLKTGLRFKDNIPYFVVKLTNRSSNAFGDINITVDTSRNIMEIPRRVKNHKILEPRETTKLAFRLVPRLVTGTDRISGSLTYFDVANANHGTCQIPVTNLSLPIPRLQPIKVSEDQWRVKTTTMKRFELETKDVPMAPGSFFSQACVPLKTLGMYMLEPIETPSLYRGVARYMAIDSQRNPFAAEVQVIGRENRCKALFVTFAPEESLAMGLNFYLINTIRNPPNFKKMVSNPST